MGSDIKMRWVTQGSSPVATGISGLLETFHRGFRPRLLLGHGSPLASQGAKGVSGPLSS